METPTLRARIKELQTEVSPYSKGRMGFNSFNFTFSNVMKCIPVLVFILLLVFRPSCVYSETTTKKGTVKKFSIKKLFLAWLLISGLCCLGWFGYTYKDTQ